MAETTGPLALDSERLRVMKVSQVKVLTNPRERGSQPQVAHECTTYEV
jgi:hypothetical protein